MSSSELIPATPLFPKNSDREIDLLALIDSLFAAKKWIVSITLACMLLGGLSAFVLPQKWTSQAIVILPDKAQLADLQTTLAQMQALDIEVKGTRADILTRFINDFGSDTAFQRWLLTSPPVLKKLIEDNPDADSMHRAIVAMSAKMVAKSNRDPKKSADQPDDNWTLSFTDSNPEQAQEILTTYIQFVTAGVRTDVLKILQQQVQFKLDLEKSKLALAREALNNEREVKIQRLKYALEIANAAGIKKPVYSEGKNVQDDPDYSIALGSDGLEAKLKVEKSLGDVAALSTDIRNSEYRIAQLTALKIPQLELMPFKYLLSPSLPVKHDGPGRTVIMLLAAMIGFILASGVVLVRQALASRHA